MSRISGQTIRWNYPEEATLMEKTNYNLLVH
jgi:hypothetical protein